MKIRILMLVWVLVFMSAQGRVEYPIALAGFEKGVIENNTFWDFGRQSVIEEHSRAWCRQDSNVIFENFGDCVRAYVVRGDSLLYSYFPGGYFDGNGAPHFMHCDYQGSVIMVTDSMATVEQHTTYYPYGEPFHEPTGQPYLFSGKERLSKSKYTNFGPRHYSPASLLWSAPDSKAHAYTPFSPYSYCAANPIQFSYPSGCSPIYTIDGSFLGTDDEGLQGDYYIMEKELFTQGMSPEEVKKKAYQGELSDAAKERIGDHYDSLPNRPDYDGYITLGEANDWYRNGNGEPLFADFSKITIPQINIPKEASKENPSWINLLFHINSMCDGLVYGHIGLYWIDDDKITSKGDQYDFDKHKGNSWLTKIRNWETQIGKMIAGDGKTFYINFYGYQRIIH